jgi:hypothetical protein
MAGPFCSPSLGSALPLFASGINRIALASGVLLWHAAGCVEEYRVRTEARGRTVDEWKLKASAVDNHWLDCLVGCAAATSMLGVSLFRGATPKKVKRKRKHVAYM